jgi:hypothetical protein
MATAVLDKSTTGEITERLDSAKLSFREAVEILSREERFMATVQAMNTLLIHKGIYTQQEFNELFCGWAKAQLDRPKAERPGWRSL